MSLFQFFTFSHWQSFFSGNSDRPITYEDLAELKYLEGVIKVGIDCSDRVLNSALKQHRQPFSLLVQYQHTSCYPTRSFLN